MKNRCVVCRNQSGKKVFLKPNKVVDMCQDCIDFISSKIARRIFEKFKPPKTLRKSLTPQEPKDS